MQLPKITIVTPSFNQVSFIERTLLSIYNQNYPNLEHIIVDGGSNDGTIDIIKLYEDKYTTLISEKDDGQTDALIKGFKMATGDILCWLCSDDLLEPGSLLKIADFFIHNSEAEFVYGDALWIDKQDKIIKSKIEHDFDQFIWLYDHNFIPQPSSFWKRELYERVGGLDGAITCAMDGYLWSRFMLETKIYHMNEVLSRMRLYPEQKNQRMRSISNFEDLIIRRNMNLGFREGATYLKYTAKAKRIILKFRIGSYWATRKYA